MARPDSPYTDHHEDPAMNSSIERLLALRVKDVMSVDVLCLRDDMTMEQAGSLLHSRGVSGAPVLDEDGLCVGVLSVADFAVRETSGVGGDGRLMAEYERLLSTESDSLVPRLTGSPDEQVCDHMTLHVRSVDAELTLIDAAREMCAEHVHRLVILNSEEQPIGLISTLDIVAAVVASVEE